MLAINTAFMTANLALKTANGVVLTKDIDAKSKHSENVLKTIDEMCESLGVSVLDVQTVAVVVGPGSFTGLRIGTAIAKALGCVNEKLRFLALSSLELMAYIVAKDKTVSEDFVCVLNALSGLYFVQTFDRDGNKKSDAKMIGVDEFEKITLPKFALKGDLRGGDLHEIEIACDDVLQFALLEERRGKFIAEDKLEPVYLRLSQAEDNLAKIKKKSV
ncbi:MAG: tRNA (adenosine(37)-N6)-threonylcarbamoyltransferase complex dimerization subunit type 1 TsaB [Clostridia bacterium]|nr:tRNA (adenosine(37)-N6)-threonylcarbamoyltransferase complex dimerization subunit type 1 TsaB [Clostridia bacterium]